MGTVDTPQRQPKKQKGKGKLGRPKRRIGIKIDMTPMVDIAFLLLIFYMVTTVFSMPQSMELNLPPKPKQDEPPPVPVAKSKLMEIMVDAQGNIFWMHTPKGQPDMELPEYIKLKDLRSFLISRVQEEPKLVIVLRIDPEARYEMMVSIIDELQIIERMFKQTDPDWSLRFSLQDMTQWEYELMERAKANMGMTDPQASQEGGT
jgi:biopolymer transport protein ExbD